MKPCCCRFATVVFFLWSALFLAARAFQVALPTASSSAHGRRWPSFLSKPVFGRRDRTLRVMAMNESSVETLSMNDLIEHGSNAWREYEGLMREVMTRSRLTDKLQAESLQTVQDYLMSNKVLLDSSLIHTDPNVTSCSYRDMLKEQKERFLNVTGFTSKEYEYCCRCLVYLGDMAAKRQKPYASIISWTKFKETGMIPRENVVSTYMYTLSSHTDLRFCSEVAAFHDRLYEPNEKTITLRIKALIAEGDSLGAERILSSLPDKGKTLEWKRLRTFQPILTHYCEVGNMAAVLRIVSQMRQSDGVYIDAETYAMVIASLARNGCFRPDAPAIDGAIEYGYAAHSGPRLFDSLASYMGEDLLELTEETAQRIYNSLVGNHGDDVSCVDIPCCDSDDSSSMIAGRVRINDTSGICPATGTRLRLFVLTSTQRRHVHDTLLEMAAQQHKEYSEKLKSQGKTYHGRNDTYAFDNLLEFSQWLQNREGEAFTVIVDGPNVAYYGHGSVHYSQVKRIVEVLEEMGERPLVTMPHKYLGPSFWLASLARVQELTDRELEVVHDLLEGEKMYVVPAACLDDYYWMLASVANQTEAKLHVSPSNNEGRLPGLRPMLVTNDQMRDHRLSLLEPREFRRWTSCHIVNYDITPYTETEWETREVSFVPADFFSREIQGNEHPNKDGSLVWHFPVTEWQEPERLCVFIAS